MHVFLTGITGYLGRHVADVLAKDGHEVVALVHSDRSRAAAEAKGFDGLAASLGAPDEWADTLSDVDAAIHTAASDDPAFAATNEAAVAAMLDALPSDARFVMQGGTLVFGPHPRPEPEPPFAPLPFLEGRARFEQAVLDGSLGKGARRSIVYGSFVHGDGGGVFPSALLQAAHRLQAVPIPGDGSAPWSVVHVRDWAALLVAAAGAQNQGGRPVFASTEIRTTSEIVDALAGKLNLPAQSLAEDSLQNALGAFGAVLAMPSAHSDAPAKALGWHPKAPSLEESFAEIARCNS